MWFGRVGLFLVALCLVAVAINAAEFRRGRRGWIDGGAADQASTTRVLVSVRQNPKGVTALESTCLDVSNPASVNYGKYISLSQVAQVVANPAALQRVTDWLSANGGQNLQLAKTQDYISADLTVGAANRMFGVRLRRYHHPENADISIVRSERGYLVEGGLRPYIDEVSGVSGFPELPASGRNGGRRNSHDNEDELSGDSNSIHGAADQVQRSVTSSVTPAPLPSPNDRLTFVPTLLPTILPTAKPAVTNLNCTGPGCPSVVHVLQYINGVELIVRQKCLDNSISNSQQTPCGNLRNRNGNERTKSPLAYYLIGVRVIDPASAQPGWTYFKIRPFRYQTNQVSISEWNLNNAIVYRVPVTTGLPAYQPMQFSIQAHFLNGEASRTEVIPVPLQHTPAMTPAYLKTFYEIVSPPAVVGSQALMFPNKDNFWATDVSKFAAEYKLQQPSNFYTIGTPAGATGGNVSTMLPTIDGSFGIQNILGINQQLPTYFWSGPTADADFYASLFASLSSSENPPLVVAGSYFIAESDAGSQMIQRTNNELMKLCARGITFITTAGNTGAFNRNPTNLGTNTCSKMAPVFPASSPYATTVGLTTPSNQVPPRYGGKLGEIPVSGESAHGFTTGGGFSLVSPRPAYQDSQVRGYLKWLGDNGLNPSGMYDVNGRAYPDVSFVGYNYRAFVAGTKVARSGDPVPAFAGTIALINSALIDRNLPPLGFLNPLLYALGTRNEAFTQAGYPFYYDVSFGNNKCGLGFVDCCAQSFSAGPGWDAVSGLGTPYYINLIESILGLPNWAFATNTTTGPSPLRT